MKFHKQLLMVTGISLFLMGAASAISLTPALSDNFTPSQKTEIEQIVHQYLIEHPEVLIEASQALQKQQLQKMAEQGEKATRENAKDILQDPNSPVVGNPKGKVTLVEFFDYQCVHCREMQSVIEKIQKDNPNLRIIFKEFPIFGENSVLAAQAALAANNQGKFLEFHQALMNSPGAIDKDFIMKTAQDLKLDMKKFNADLKDKKLTQALKNNYQLATKLGLDGTPAFIVTSTNLVNNNKLPVTFFPGTTPGDAIQDAIDKAGK